MVTYYTYTVLKWPLSTLVQFYGLGKLKFTTLTQFYFSLQERNYYTYTVLLPVEQIMNDLVCNVAVILDREGKLLNLHSSRILLQKVN